MGTKQEFIESLEKSILKVYNDKDEEITYNTLEIKDYKSKYSSSGSFKRTLFLDGVPYTGNKKYKVLYRCSCGKINTILLKKFMLKEKLTCRTCVEHDPEKIAWQKEYFQKKRNGETRGRKQKKEIKTYDFKSESKDFRNKYFENNLTEEEFKDILTNIYSIDDIVISGKDIVFLPYEPCYNSKKYRNMVLIDGEKHNLRKIVLKCSTCGCLFKISRPLKDRVRANNFKCKYCYLVNNNFMIHKFEDGLTYQSNEELTFIKRCKEKGIEVKDGPKIKYESNGTKHTYYVDFSLPDLKYNIEIKDNHIWHLKQVESGIWEAKENAAIEYSEKQGYEFKVLFPNDIDEFISILKR